MYHFVALLWCADDPSANETATQLKQRFLRVSVRWETLLTTDGIVVFALPPTDPSLRSYVLPDEAGVVLGKLFSADLSKPSLDSIEQIDERETREIVRTGGQYLLRNFWGGYVALLARLAAAEGLPGESVVQSDMRDLSSFVAATFHCVRNHASLHHLPLLRAGDSHLGLQLRADRIFVVQYDEQHNPVGLRSVGRRQRHARSIRGYV